MKYMFSLMLALALVVPALGQTIIVDAAGASGGKYWIEVSVGADGKVQATVVGSENIVVLAGEDPGGPVDPPASGIATVALKAKDLVTDSDKAGNAVRVSAVYQTIGKQIGDTFTHEGGDAPWQKLANATKTIRSTILGDDAVKWQPWADAIGKALAAMETANQLGDDAAMRAAYEDIAAGVVSDLSREEINPEVWAIILEIVQMILKMWLGGGFGVTG